MGCAAFHVTCKEEKEYIHTFLVQKVNISITRIKENLIKMISYREGRHRSQVSLKVPLHQ